MDLVAIQYTLFLPLFSRVVFGQSSGRGTFPGSEGISALAPDIGRSCTDVGQDDHPPKDVATDIVCVAMVAV